MKILKAILVLSCFITVLFSAGCDSVLPDEFQEKNYKSSDMDNSACTGLSQTATDSLGNLVNSNFHAVRLLKLRNALPPADTAALQGLPDNVIIQSKFSQLVSGLPVLKTDSLYLVSYPAAQNTSYAAITVSQGSDFSLYTSLEYNTANINQYVTIQLIKSDTTEVAVTDNMTGEAVSTCAQVIVVDSRDRIVPTIKSRLKFHLDPGSYVLRFTVSQPLLVGPFKIIIL